MRLYNILLFSGQFVILVVNKEYFVQIIKLIF